MALFLFHSSVIHNKFKATYYYFMFYFDMKCKYGGGVHSNTRVVHMRNQRNAKKSFLRLAEFISFLTIF